MSHALEQLYQQVILDHAKTRVGNTVPVHGVEGAEHSPFIGSSFQVNPTCGDEITLEAEIDPATGKLSVRWDGQGCSISMASASVLAEMANGATPGEMAPIEAGYHELMHSRGTLEADEEVLGDAAAFQGVSKFPARIKCALLSWMAYKDALAQAQTLKEQND